MPTRDTRTPLRVPANRRTMRLAGYDYTRPGTYFVTICTRAKAPLLGEIAGLSVRLTDAGRIVRDCWLDIPRHFPHVTLDVFVIMPDHVHGIVVITAADPYAVPTHSVARDTGGRIAGTAIAGTAVGATADVGARRDMVGARRDTVGARGNVGARHAGGRIRGTSVAGTLITGTANGETIGGTVGGTNVGAQHAAPLHHNQYIDNIDPAPHIDPNSPAPPIGAAPLCTHPDRPRVTPGSLGAIVRAFKSAATRRINLMRGTPRAPLWQRNYHERIIGEMDGLRCVRWYIVTNPRRTSGLQD